MEDVRQLARIVHLEIASEHVDGFKKVMLPHAENSRKEPGCLRFDVLQEAEAPNKFTLYEERRRLRGAPENGTVSRVLRFSRPPTRQRWPA
ncbi:unnamed protein product [Polarella glacialis]|uniref:ABM domain-containing protein n=1 Tax=Polarella glacialis TaxID=89957 RepID=A0A813II60_POLGL|nr:unnamed protein product [Polarella glacialis]